jgi:predicted DNA-binding protein
MAKNEDTRDASLRVSKKMRDNLKAAAAVAGRPLYEVTNEAINNYLNSTKSAPRKKK